MLVSQEYSWSFKLSFRKEKFFIYHMYFEKKSVPYVAVFRRRHLYPCCLPTVRIIENNEFVKKNTPFICQTKRKLINIIATFFFYLFYFSCSSFFIKFSGGFQSTNNNKKARNIFSIQCVFLRFTIRTELILNPRQI